MEPIFTAIYERLEAAHDAIKQAIEGLSTEQLDYVPGPDMNSLTVLITHTTGAERYLIGDFVGRDPSQRVRAEEFETRGQTAEALTARLDEVLAHSRGVLERLTTDDLATEYEHPRVQRMLTVAWALSHALEHTALHAGHIEITRQLIDQRGG